MPLAHFDFNHAGAYEQEQAFTLADFRACFETALMKRGRAKAIVQEVRAAVSKWPDYTKQAQALNTWRQQTQRNLRLDLPGR